MNPHPKNNLLFAFLILLFSTFTCWNCRSSALVGPPLESYNAKAMSIKTSVLQIPIEIDQQKLQQSLNQKLGNTLYEDDRYGSDDLQLKVTKQDNIILGLDNQILKCTVPMDVWAKKNTVLGSIEGKGQLSVELETAFAITEDWQLETTTIITRHEWTQRPKVKVGPVNLPIQFIANKVIEKSKNTLANEIDNQIRKQLNLKDEVKRAWQLLHRPVLLDEKSNAWLLVSPQSLSMTPLQQQNDKISSQIMLKTAPEIAIGQQPESIRRQPLPPFLPIEKADKTFSIHLQASAPMEEVQKLVEENLNGETFDISGRKIKIEQSKIYGSDDKLAIVLTTSGDYNGEIFVQGKPIYDLGKNEITLEDIEVDFSNQRLLLKTVAFLFKRKIRETINNEINIGLKDNLKVIEETISGELNRQISKGISLTGTLGKLTLSEVHLTQKSIEATVELTGELQVKLEDIF